MFRLLRLRPPHGWNAVAWELAIVTLGVLLALAVQQWAEDRTTKRKLESTKAALRGELSEHYDHAVEFRTVYPCVQAQLRRLLDRVLASGPVMDPIPLHKEVSPVQRNQDFEFMLRLPSKVHPTDAWDAAVGEGLVHRFEPAFRRQLAGHYARIPDMRRLIHANDDAAEGMAALRHPLPIESAVRYSIVKEIEQMRFRLDTLDLFYGQEIEYIQNVGMLPPPEEAQVFTERYGTFRFCKAQGLPMRSYKEAREAVPN